MASTISKPTTDVCEVITRKEQLEITRGGIQERIPLTWLRGGKVRETFDRDEYSLLLVTTDRWSAFDVRMPQGIPLKGRILNGMSNLTFELTRDIVPNHIITTNMNEAFRGSERFLHLLNGRGAIVKKASPIPFECVVRGYIYGSGWEDYLKTGAVCGIKLPEGLRKAQKLDEPIFTPATKSESGHDENVPFEFMRDKLRAGLGEEMREKSLALYKRLSDYASARGQILADTKFEFGFVDGRLTLIDEAVTPDSSRLWYANLYEVGRDQEGSNDKQFLRDWLRNEGGWTKEAQAQGVEPPMLPADVLAEATGRYVRAYTTFTGKEPQVVAMLLGSESDSKLASEAAAPLEKLGLWFGRQVISAHRTPRALEAYLKEVDANPFVRLYIAGAGLAAALPGAVAAWTIKPVIGVPASGELSLMGGLDAVMSMVQMPPGVPVGTVGPVNHGRNAGIYAAQILAVGDRDLQRRLRETLRKEG